MVMAITVLMTLIGILQGAMGSLQIINAILQSRPKPKEEKKEEA